MDLAVAAERAVGGEPAAAPATELVTWGALPALRRWTLLFAAWTFVALLFASQIYLGMLDHGHSWWRMLLWQATA